MADFVHLHVHTEYSLLDGACRIEKIAEQVASLGQKAIAITDHGNMYGVIDFYKACKAAGVKPIIGCEVYVAPRTRFDKVHKLDSSPYHLVLLCKDKTGYQNLIQLVSTGYIDGFYNRPRVDHESLAAHHEGLICLSACLAGELPRMLLANDYKRAYETACFYRDLFGKENYFIEIQDHGIPEQKEVLPQLVKLAKEVGVGLVATNDAHYLTKADSRVQAVLIAIQTNTLVGESSLEFSTDEFYLKSGEEMQTLFGAYAGALENTVKIAERCNLEFEFGKTKLPHFVAPDGMDNTDYFLKLCNEGLLRRYGEHPDPALRERLDYEISIIRKMGYVDYYLIVYDFIHYAKQHEIPVGPGRGSGAGSIAAYCIGITDIDPIRYQLLFERFLNPERVSMPDFDIDFCTERRQEVIRYVVEKYGSDHVAQIITFGTMAARGSVRDVGRAMGMPYQAVDRVAKSIPMALHMTIARAMTESKELKAMYDSDDEVRRLIDTAQQLEGMPRNASTHAAGVVITRDRVVDYVPVQKEEDAIVMVTQFPMTTLEELGLLKMDFLGLRNLTVIHDAQTRIRKRIPDFDIRQIDLDDPETYEMLSSGQSQAVFQMESSGMRQVITQLRPTSLEDLIAVISLYRPGPMDSIPLYIQNRHHPENITYKHPLLKPILEVTYGCIVYQEQVMQICRALAGYSYGRADLVRRAMAKKKHDVMAEERRYFIHGKKNDDGTVDCPGAVANGVPELVASEIFDEMSSFASYAFNKSHAAAYALVAFQTAYLKCHFTTEYMSAWLTSIMDNNGKLIENIEVCKALGIQVLPPSINESEMGFTVVGKHIRFGLLAVKSIGRGFIEKLVEERETHGDYKSLYDFCDRMQGKDLNKRTVENLIKCGAFDGLGQNRHQMLAVYERMLDNIDSTKRQNVSGQMNLFGAAVVEQYHADDLTEYPMQELLNMEKEITGLYISGHPLDAYADLAAQHRFEKIRDVSMQAEEREDNRKHLLLCAVQSAKTLRTRAGKTMAFVTIEDTTGTMEAVVFQNLYEQVAALLSAGQVLVIKGTLSVRENEAAKILCDRVIDVRDFKGAAEKPETLYIKLQGREDPRIAPVLALLKAHRGAKPVRIFFEREKKSVSPRDCKTVEISDALLRSLSDLLDERDVIVK